MEAYCQLNVPSKPDDYTVEKMSETLIVNIIMADCNLLVQLGEASGEMNMIDYHVELLIVYKSELTSLIKLVHIFKGHNLVKSVFFKAEAQNQKLGDAGTQKYKNGRNFVESR